MKKTLFATALVILVSSTAFAMGGSHRGAHHNLAFIINKYLDLSETQQAEIEQLTQGKHNNPHEMRKRMFKQIMALDPDAIEYETLLQTLAESQAQKIKQTIIERGQLRAKIHALLSTEQKLKLNDVMKEVIARHEKKKRHHF